MKIHIEDLNFQTIIGILDFERVTPQNVIINLIIEYEFSNEFINYAEVSNLIQNRMIEKKFLLLEDALEDLSRKLKKNFPLINTLDLKITKPSIMPNSRVSVSNFYKFFS